MRDVAPLGKRNEDAPERPASPTRLAPSPDLAPPRRRQPAAVPKPLPALRVDAAPGLDRRSIERLRRGLLPIEARLDLHGMTQDEAHRALADFLMRSEAKGRRSVLVITGKGSRAGGVLRAAVPRWLNESPNRQRLLGFAPAQPKDGGEGALYLLLRRKR